MNCREVAGLATEHHESTLPEPTEAALQEHLDRCDACALLDRQLRRTRIELGALSATEPAGESVAQAMARFRSWSRARGVTSEPRRPVPPEKTLTWIKTIAPDEAEGELKRLYQAIASDRGGIAMIHQAQSLNVRALRAHLELYKAVVFQRSSLSRVARERIGVVVSSANGCGYCVAHHTEALRQLGDDEAVCDALSHGEIPVDALGNADVKLLRWARQAALEPALTSEQIIADLRGADLDDRAILDAALTVAYFSFVNRLVFLLGVPIEDDYAASCQEPAHQAR